MSEGNIRSLSGKSGVIPTKLTLRDFMSHKDTSVRFGDLTIIYSRMNGAGKTSFLEGLMYAYTGETLRGMDRDFRVTDVIRRGSSGARVIMEGVRRVPGDGGEEPELQSIYLKRRRTKSGPKVALRIDGEPVEDPGAFLENVTDARTFSRVTMINGHDVLTFLEGTPKDRADMLDRLFGIDVLEAVRSEMSTRSLEKELVRVNEDIASGERLRRLLENSGSAQQKLAELSQEIAELSAKKGDLEERLREARDEEAETRREALEIREKKRLEKELMAKAEAKEGRLAAVEERISNERARAAGVEEMIEDLRERFGGRESGDYIAEKEARRKALVRKVQNEEAVPSVIDLAIEELESGEAESCPVCGSECSVEDLRRQRERIVGLHEERKEHLRMLEDELEDLRAARERIERLRVKLGSIEEALRRLEAEGEELERERGRLLEEAGELEWSEEQLVELEEGLGDPESSKLAGRIGELGDRIADLSARRDSLAGEADDVPEEAEIPDLADLESKKRRISGLIDKFNRYRSAVTEMRRSLRERMVERVNGIINEYLDTFQPDIVDRIRVDLSRKSYRGEVQYRYEIVAEDSYGRDLPFSGLSTGQKATVLVSLVLSINDISANRLPVVLFDEIQASGLDEEGLKILVYMIVTLARVRNMVITSRSHDFVRDIQEELNRVDEEGNAIHDIGAEAYEFELATEGQGIPLTVQSPYALEEDGG